MNSTSPKNNSSDKLPKPTPPPLKRRRYSHFSYSAQQKAQAVLAVWTERCSPADICRQMNITPIMFYQWQQRAMQAMLQGLESQVNLRAGAALNPRLQALLEKYQQSNGAAKTSQRLEQIQNNV